MYFQEEWHLKKSFCAAFPSWKEFASFIILSNFNLSASFKICCKIVWILMVFLYLAKHHLCCTQIDFFIRYFNSWCILKACDFLFFYLCCAGHVKALHPTHPALWKAIDGRIQRWAQATLAPVVLDCHSAFAPSQSPPPHSLRNSRSHRTAWPPSPASDRQHRLRPWRWWRREEARRSTILTLTFLNQHTHMHTQKK